MIKLEASDLYLAAGSKPKFMQHGKFLDAADVMLIPENTRAYALELLTPPQQAEFQREWEVNVSYSVRNEGRFRVNLYTQRGSVAIVIRRITSQIPTFRQLNLPERLGELAMGERGLVLVVGATGSGKSTTLAAMIEYRNERVGGHIVTIEDPIEFTFTNKKSLITQREVGIDTKSFPIALKNSLRQSPKVIFIGEIRDTQTMEFALQASETGHLTLASLHANNASQAFERIMGFFPLEHREQALAQLSMSLRGIVAQRLLPRVGGGRIPVLETLIVTPFISELVGKGDIERIKQAMNEGAGEGLQTFDMDIHRLWSERKIS